MRKDFDKQWRRRRAWRGRCPLDDDELRRRVLLAQQAGEPAAVTAHPARRRWLWAPAAAAVAACMLLLMLPKNGGTEDYAVDCVNVDGLQFFYACNCGCSATSTLSTLNNIRR